MVTPTITPAMRINALRIEQDAPLGSTIRRAISKARYVDGFPHCYTEQMIRWAEQIILAMWDTTVPWDEVVDLYTHAEEAGWLN